MKRTRRPQTVDGRQVMVSIPDQFLDIINSLRNLHETKCGDGPATAPRRSDIAGYVPLAAGP